MSKTDQETIDRLSQSEATRQPLTIEFPKNWPIMAVLIVLASLLVIWAFWGRIPTQINGQGVSLNPSGTFLVEANTAGKMIEFFVHEGEEVEKSAPLGVIYNPDLKSLLVQIETTEYKIIHLKSELALLDKALEINEELFEEGLVAKLIVDGAKAKVYDKQISIEEAKSELKTLFSKLENSSPASGEIVQWAKGQLLDSKPTLDLQSIEDELSIIRSPEKGTVLEILVGEGDHIDRKEPIIWVEHPLDADEQEVFYSTVNANVIGRVEPGMRVLIEPLIVNPREYGAIIGEVKDVYPYPVSQEELVQTIGNKQIVKFLLGESPVVTLLVVNPKSDPETVSGFEWTSEQGPPFTIPTGTVCNLKLVIEEQPPISYLIPLWRIKEPFTNQEPEK